MNTLIIAEAGVNNNGSVELSYKLIDAAKEAGADIVKFQTGVPEKIISGIDFLDSIGMDIWKIPSGEITNLPYLILKWFDVIGTEAIRDFGEDELIEI